MVILTYTLVGPLLMVWKFRLCHAHVGCISRFLAKDASLKCAAWPRTMLPSWPPRLVQGELRLEQIGPYCLLRSTLVWCPILWQRLCWRSIHLMPAHPVQEVPHSEHLPCRPHLSAFRRASCHQAPRTCFQLGPTTMTTWVWYLCNMDPKLL